MDNLKFKKGAFINDVVVIIARITYVGRTSMEVRVDVFFEERETGHRFMINRAYFTEVCIDEKGKPIPVPYGIEPVTEVEKAEYDGALKRIEIRKIRRAEGY